MGESLTERGDVRRGGEVVWGKSGEDLVVYGVDDAAVGGIDDGIFEHGEIDLSSTLGGVPHTCADDGDRDIAVASHSGPTVPGDVR